MQDRLEKTIKAIEKIKKECGKHEQHDGCPYFFKKECSAISTLPFLKEFAERNPEEKSIVLKNIDLSEVIEERTELFDALNKFKEDEDTKEHVIEELYDNIQALLGLVQKFGINAEEVMEGYQKHLDKMEQRGNKPREGRK